MFQISGRLSPDWTHWRDGPTHQEWPQDQVRPQGQSPVTSYPIAYGETGYGQGPGGYGPQDSYGPQGGYQPDYGQPASSGGGGDLVFPSLLRIFHSLL